MVHPGFQHPTMATKKQAKAAVKRPTARVTVSFPTDLHETLEQIAKAQKVSFGWIVRDAAEKYISDRWPLLGKGG